ncbi:MAG: VOC family protein [Planctomycetes bacterium]|nr:VOC family protein [Planctomycetota bacterium]
MERVVPVLQIDDYQQACDYYVDGLGFSIDFEHRHEPGFPVFMGIRKGELYMHLSEHGRGHPGTEVYVFVDDVKFWYERCQAKSVPTDGPPDAKPWGNTELALKDPFRNLLRITQIGTHKGQSTPNKPG